MWRATIDEAQEELKNSQRYYPDSKFRLREVPGGRGFEILQVQHCSQCNAEMLTGGGWDKPAICEDCSRKKKMRYLAQATQEGEARREALRHERDFEEVCQ